VHCRNGHGCLWQRFEPVKLYLNVKRKKSIIIKIVNRVCVKKMFKNIYFIGLKKKRLIWVFLDIEEIRDKDDETGLKEGRR
jgi:hypothetical protein